VADLKSDFVGRVNRLALKPSDKTCLVPVMEAVSNSIHAITERFDDMAGICIEYRSLQLLEALPSSASFVRVSYDDKPVFISSRDAKNHHFAAKKILSQKKFNWAYEREWRLLGDLQRNSIRSKKAIRRVYLGTRVSEHHKNKLRKALHGYEIGLYEMVVKGYTYSYKKLRPSRSLP
jgi:hypothetical protein